MSLTQLPTLLRFPWSVSLCSRIWGHPMVMSPFGLPDWGSCLGFSSEMVLDVLRGTGHYIVGLPWPGFTWCFLVDYAVFESIIVFLPYHAQNKNSTWGGAGMWILLTSCGWGYPASLLCSLCTGVAVCGPCFKAETAPDVDVVSTKITWQLLCIDLFPLFIYLVFSHTNSDSCIFFNAFNYFSMKFIPQFK